MAAPKRTERVVLLDGEQDGTIMETDTEQQQRPQSSIPQLLTFSDAQELVEYLDAGDALECYLLTRQTYLHYSFGVSSSESNSNTTSSSTGNSGHKIPIQTTALGLRYRPPPGGSKAPLDLTLEYGPNREGRDNLQLSVPLIQESENPFDDDSWKPVKVTWANEGQVYYTTQISQDDYVTANYMASLTGAVLSDLLATASAYPTLRRRYQPWEVVTDDGENNSDGKTSRKRLLFRSNSDYDFVQYLFQHLASVGVELSPVLIPIYYRLRLNAVRIQRNTFSPQGQKKMSQFYQNLYTCLESLATATVLAPPPTPQPTSSPTVSLPPTSSTRPTTVATVPNPQSGTGQNAGPTNTPPGHRLLEDPAHKLGNEPPVNKDKGTVAGNVPPQTSQLGGQGSVTANQGTVPSRPALEGGQGTVDGAAGTLPAQTTLVQGSTGNVPGGVGTVPAQTSPEGGTGITVAQSTQQGGTGTVASNQGTILAPSNQQGGTGTTESIQGSPPAPYNQQGGTGTAEIIQGSPPAPYNQQGGTGTAEIIQGSQPAPYNQQGGTEVNQGAAPSPTTFNGGKDSAVAEVKPSVNLPGSAEIETTTSGSQTLGPMQNDTSSEQILPSVSPVSLNSNLPSSMSASMTPTIAPSISVQPPTPAPISHVDAAAEAAAAAQHAADAADDNPEQAAEAAKQAASAAQKAATATAQQQAALRQEALLSGNGVSMAQTASLCLSDPLYGIAVKGKNSTTVYLYRDSTYFYTVEVVAPYIQVVPFSASLPKPTEDALIPQGLVVDWVLALILIVFLFLSVLLILQHVLGRNFHVVPSLYKFQRWFFNPRNVAYDDLQHTDEAKQEEWRAGYMYTFDHQNGISDSHGGVRVVSASEGQAPSGEDAIQPSHLFSNGNDDDPFSGNGSGHSSTMVGDDVFGDVELSTRSSNRKSQARKSFASGSSFHDDELDALDCNNSRLFRDPELVELPDLKSKTKVAVPVSMSRQSTHSSASSG